jgi:predicted ArsR family transcriptional regulator
MPTKPIRIRLLEALEQAPMTTDSLADQLGTSVAVVRTRLAEYRKLGAVRVVARKEQGIYGLNVWAIAQANAA